VDKKIYIASDHAGFLAKTDICELLVEMGVNFEDLGPNSEDSVDYPDYAKKVCTAVQSDLNNSLGILICGSGTGMAIAANKFKGIRASFSYDAYSAKFAKQDNDANVLTLRAREFDHTKYEEILKVFLETEFSGIPRHQNRIDEVMSFEKL
jgi:ribose 5-phosphate isomerase B